VFVHENALEVGESLMMKRILVKPNKLIKELAKRKKVWIHLYRRMYQKLESL
jgi:hypothetical protein